jgi:peroxiredoxin
MVLLYSTLVPLGSSLIKFSLSGTDGKTYTHASFSGKKALIIVFTCNHCPYAQALEERLIALQKKYLCEEVQIIAINSNDGEQYPDDRFKKMKEKRYPFPYLHDETQEVAKAYQAQCTPDIYIYDQEQKLAYHGRFDDNWQNEAGVTSHDTENALIALLKNETPSEVQYPSMGCSIKWKK